MANKTKKQENSNGRVQDFGPIDIPHEDVSNTITDQGLQPYTPKVMTPEETAQQEIKKFNLADSAIAALKEKYGGLKISGPDDKEGYKAVKEAWQDVRSKRTGTEKKGKELRDGYTVINRAIIKEEDRIVYEIKPLEDQLYKTWKAIDEEKERAENERKAAEEKGFMERLETLQKLGMVLGGGFYTIGEDINFDAATLRAMPEDRFLTLKAKAKSIFERAEADRLRQADERRKEAEAYELAKKELAEQRAQMERDREAMETLRREQENQLLDLRVNKLLGLGMHKGQGQLSFQLSGIMSTNIIIDTLPQMSATVFNELFEDTAKEIKAAKDKQAQKDAELEAAARERERREKLIAAALEEAGMKFNYADKKFEYKLGDYYTATDFTHMLQLSDDQVMERAADIATDIARAKERTEKQEKERQAQAEAERKAGMSDKELMINLLMAVDYCRAAVKEVKFKTKKYQGSQASIAVRLSEILHDYKPD